MHGFGGDDLAVVVELHELAGTLPSAVDVRDVHDYDSLAVCVFQDVIELANTTFFALGEYTLEESFYWRGRAKLALGDMNGALFDLKKAVELNPQFTPAREELEQLGEEAY